MIIVVVVTTTMRNTHKNHYIYVLYIVNTMLINDLIRFLNFMQNLKPEKYVFKRRQPPPPFC